MNRFITSLFGILAVVLSTSFTTEDSAIVEQQVLWEIYNPKQGKYMSLRNANPKIKTRIVAYWHATIFKELEIAANYPSFNHEVNIFIRSKITSTPMTLRMGAEYNEAYISGFAIDLERGGKIVSVNSGNTSYSGNMVITHFDKRSRLISGRFEFESKAYKDYKARGSFTDIKIPE